MLFACTSSIKVCFIADQYLGNLQLGYAKRGLGISFPRGTISDLKRQALRSSVLETICLGLNSGSSGESLNIIPISSPTKSCCMCCCICSVDGCNL